MPYSKVSELPDAVKSAAENAVKNYPPGKRQRLRSVYLKAFMKAFNAALNQYGKEDVAFKVAHTAAQNAVKAAAKKKDGKMKEFKGSRSADHGPVGVGSSMRVVSFENPVMVGAALTNYPFVTRQGEVEIVEDDGRQVFRVPLLRRSAWKHPRYGKLIFDDGVLQQIVDNFNSNVLGQVPPLKIGHSPKDQPATGWFYKLSLDPDGHLVGYAEPTGDDALDVIRSKKYRYASVELLPRWRQFEDRIPRGLSIEEILDAYVLMENDDDGEVDMGKNREFDFQEEVI